MSTVYPIILTPEKEGGYSVNVPDLQIGTQGETIAECIEMARDAIGLWAMCEQDEGRPVPVPVSLAPEHADNEILTLVDVDFKAYRKAHDMRTVRKNVSIQSWLNDLAERENINFSQVLQDGLKERLGVKSPR